MTSLMTFTIQTRRESWPLRLVFAKQLASIKEPRQQPMLDWLNMNGNASSSARTSSRVVSSTHNDEEQNRGAQHAVVRGAKVRTTRNLVHTVMLQMTKKTDGANKDGA